MFKSKNSKKGTFLLIMYLLYSCSSLEIKKEDYTIKNNILNSQIPEIIGYEEYEDILIVDINSQMMFLVNKGTVSREFVISSSFLLIYIRRPLVGHGRVDPISIPIFR